LAFALNHWSLAVIKFSFLITLSWKCQGERSGGWSCWSCMEVSWSQLKWRLPNACLAVQQPRWLWAHSFCYVVGSSHWMHSAVFSLEVSTWIVLCWMSNSWLQIRDASSRAVCELQLSSKNKIRVWSWCWAFKNRHADILKVHTIDHEWTSRTLGWLVLCLVFVLRSWNFLKLSAIFGILRWLLRNNGVIFMSRVRFVVFSRDLFWATDWLFDLADQMTDRHRQRDTERHTYTDRQTDQQTESYTGWRQDTLLDRQVEKPTTKQRMPNKRSRLEVHLLTYHKMNCYGTCSYCKWPYMKIMNS